MSSIALLVYDVSLTGGAERVAINLANEFVKNHRVSIISVHMSKNAPGSIDKGILMESLSEKNGSITLHFHRYRKQLNTILQKQKADILLAITAGIVTLAVEGVKGTDTKVIYCEHSNLENRTYGKKHIFRQYYGSKRANHIVTLTERDRKNFQRIFHVPEKRVTAIPNWYSQHRSSSAYNRQSKKIISVGRLETVKGYDYIIDCAKAVLNNHPDWSWDIYGDGSLKNELQQKIDTDHLDGLHLMGNVSDLEEKYSEYAFMVMTSLYEGLPLSLLEAQEAGLPIISFDCPTGPSEIILDQINGLLIKPNNLSDLIDAVEKLIDSERMRAEYSAHSHDHLGYYEKNKILESWESLFDLVLYGEG